MTEIVHYLELLKWGAYCAIAAAALGIIILIHVQSRYRELKGILLRQNNAIDWMVKATEQHHGLLVDIVEQTSWMTEHMAAREEGL